MAHDDAPSEQLRCELRSSVSSALASRRPIIHHLNEDTSWLLSLPRPEIAVKRGARFYYNILIDPWFQGGQSDVASWFSQQFHATPSAVQTIAEVDQLIRELENLTAAAAGGGRAQVEEVEEANDMAESWIDAVAISHEFTDHCHKETLLEVHPDIPVFAGGKAGSLIRSWGHFRTVVDATLFGQGGDTDWRSTSMPPLPEWIGIGQIRSTEDVLYYHSALMITFNNRHGNRKARLTAKAPITRKGRRHRPVVEPNEDDETAEAIIYTPHGIQSDDLAIIPKASPSISTLAFLHGLHNVRIGTLSGRTALQLNLGVQNGLKAQRILNADYWCGTHDEVKKGGGLVAFFLQRDMLTLKDALDQERAARRQKKDGCLTGELGEALDSFEGTNWIDLRNGESRVLL